MDIVLRCDILRILIICIEHKNIGIFEVLMYTKLHIVFKKGNANIMSEPNKYKAVVVGIVHAYRKFIIFIINNSINGYINSRVN